MADPTAMLNAMAQASPKKRKEPSSGHEQSPRKRVAFSSPTEEQVFPPARDRDRSTDAAKVTKSRTSLSKVPRSATRSRNNERDGSIYDIVDDGRPVDHAQRAAPTLQTNPNPNRTKKRTIKPKARKSVAFDPQREGGKELQENVTGVTLSSSNTPARQLRSTKNPLERLRGHVVAGKRPVSGKSNRAPASGAQRPRNVSQQPQPSEQDQRHDALEQLSPNLLIESNTTTPQLQQVENLLSRDAMHNDEGRNEASPSIENAEDSRDDTDDDESEVEAVATKPKPKPKPRWQKPTQEELEAAKRRNARKRQAALEALKVQEKREAEARAKKYLRGIENLVEPKWMGSLDDWAALGSNAEKITSLIDKNSQVTNKAVREIWDHLQCLDEALSDIEEPPDDDIVDSINQLTLKANSKHMKKTKKGESFEDSLIDLYRHIIPKSVITLKKYLCRRFVPDHRHCWEELSHLVQASTLVCEFAIEELPKKVGLEAGVRSAIRSIRSALVEIDKAVQSRIRKLENVEEMQRRRERYLTRPYPQEESREEHARGRFPQGEQRERDAEETQLLASKTSRQRPDPPSQMSSRSNIIDVDDLYNSEEQDRDQTRTLKHDQRPPVGESPFLSGWSEIEHGALLSSLQIYIGPNRYDEMLTGTYAAYLRARSADECADMARKWKLASAGIEFSGKSGFEFLRDV